MKLPLARFPLASNVEPTFAADETTLPKNLCFLVLASSRSAGTT
jgi:hypothetical protein